MVDGQNSLFKKSEIKCGFIGRQKNKIAQLMKLKALRKNYFVICN